MTTLLGLDLGEQRIGLAIAKAPLSVALPLAAITKTGSKAEGEILSLIEKEGVTKMIVGLPLNEEGTETCQSEKIRRFCRRLSKRKNIEIIFIDEYGSSLDAEERLSHVAKGRRHHRKSGVIDSIAAASILQSYLDSHLTDAFGVGREN